MKVLVTGAGGMVGRAVANYCQGQGDQVFAHNHQSLDIADPAAVRATLDQERPEVIINCAAWTDVDGCESDSQRAYRVNAQGPETLAMGSRRISALLITISTDYVFDGAKTDYYYTQRDDPNPQGIYAAAKLDGERRAQTASARTIVVRTGWIFGIGGTNFLSTVIERAERNEHLKAIKDATGTPTYAVDLAARLYTLAQLDLPGIYHIVNSGGGTNYAEFARAVLDAAHCESRPIEGVEMNTLRRPAARPRNSQLRCLLSEAIGLPPLPEWKTALHAYVEGHHHYYHHHHTGKAAKVSEHEC